MKMSNLSVLAYANGFTMWHYKTDDVQVARGEGYFDDADMLAVGDFMLISGNTGGAQVWVIAVTPHVVTL